jgi:Ion transport protein
VKVIQSTLENFIYICGLMFLFCIIYSLLGMQMYGGEFNFRDNKINGDFDSFYTAFLVIFQMLTIENWNDIITLTFRSGQNKFLSSLYLLTWIFIGNYVFLNLFLAILMDGFCSALDDNEEEELDMLADHVFMLHIE